VDDPGLLSRVAVVLWRPKSPGNIGSVARAMKNMGLTRLRIAGPPRYDDPSFFRTEAGKMAWDAGDVLDARTEYSTFEAAVADAVLVAGTTSAPPDGHAVLSPRDLAPRLLDAAGRGTVALVLARENLGLTREIRARCQLLGTIPSSPAYASLNLAQAALIFLYEIRLAAMTSATAAPQARQRAPRPGAGAAAPPAQAEMERFYGRLMETLDAIGFFAGGARAHMARDLRRIFNRALLTRRDVRILEGIVRRVRLNDARKR
jgi:tRNA (cytidine32/uridine32-2'-O)-methyltransferase